MEHVGDVRGEVSEGDAVAGSKKKYRLQIMLERALGFGDKGKDRLQTMLERALGFGDKGFDN